MYDSVIFCLEANQICFFGPPPGVFITILTRACCLSVLQPHSSSCLQCCQCIPEFQPMAVTLFVAETTTELIGHLILSH